MHQKISTYCGHIVLQHTLSAIVVDTGKVRGGMGRFKGGLRSKGWVNSVIINILHKLITDILHIGILKM